MQCDNTFNSNSKTCELKGTNYSILSFILPCNWVLNYYKLLDFSCNTLSVYTSSKTSQQWACFVPDSGLLISHRLDQKHRNSFTVLMFLFIRSSFSCHDLLSLLQIAGNTPKFAHPPLKAPFGQMLTDSGMAFHEWPASDHKQLNSSFNEGSGICSSCLVSWLTFS